MRTAAILLFGFSIAAPASAQAPWQQQSAPGPYGPGVPGAPYAPGVPYVPGAPTPYGYGSEAWRYRQMEAEHRAHERQEQRLEERAIEHRGGQPVVGQRQASLHQDAAPSAGAPPSASPSTTALRGHAKALPGGASATPAPSQTPTCGTKVACGRK